MTKPISATKFRNAIKRIDPNGSIVADVKNIRINGQLRGYSGFVTETRTGRNVYVSYEPEGPSIDLGFYRVASHSRDFTGGRNRWSKGEDMPLRVVALLHSDTYDTDGAVLGEQSPRDIQDGY